MTHTRSIIAAIVIAAIVAISISGCRTADALNSHERALYKDSLEKYASPARWKEDIARFEKMDRENPPPRGTVLFVGSSSIRMWDTDKYFPDMVTINRGFGGSHIIDSVYYADKIVIPYAPRVIVFYAGDNDIADGKSPEMLRANCKAFVIKVRQSLPETKIIYISIKPSIARWKLWPKMKAANVLIRDYCAGGRELVFVDVELAMLGADGKPRLELFMADGLHLSGKGYELWTSLLSPYIQQ
jgi:lysophospholipase L1-like esterase